LVNANKGKQSFGKEAVKGHIENSNIDIVQTKDEADKTANQNA